MIYVLPIREVSQHSQKPRCLGLPEALNRVSVYGFRFAILTRNIKSFRLVPLGLYPLGFGVLLRDPRKLEKGYIKAILNLLVVRPWGYNPGTFEHVVIGINTLRLRGLSKYIYNLYRHL